MMSGQGRPKAVGKTTAGPGKPENHNLSMALNMNPRGQDQAQTQLAYATPLVRFSQALALDATAAGAPVCNNRDKLAH